MGSVILASPFQPRWSGSMNPGVGIHPAGGAYIYVWNFRSGAPTRDVYVGVPHLVEWGSAPSLGWRTDMEETFRLRKITAGEEFMATAQSLLA